MLKNAVLAGLLAASATLAGILGVKTNELQSINPATGAATVLARGLPFSGDCLARDANGLLYTNGPSAGRVLYTIDPVTYAVTNTGVTVALPAGRTVFGCAFQPGTDTLFVIGYNSGDGTRGLYSVNKATGAATAIGGNLTLTPRALEFSSAGVLYSWSPFYGLLTINTSTGAVTDVNPADNGANPDLQDLAFDPATGVLYGARNQLYTVNIATGASSLVGGTLSDIRGSHFTLPPGPGGLFSKWVSVTGGSAIPANAFVGGNTGSADEVVCRASHQGGIHPGKAVSGNCFIEYGGAEVGVSTYEVLTQFNGAWHPSSGGFVFSGSFPVGSESGQTLYSCRAYLAGGIHLGKIRPGFTGCKIGNLTQGHTVPFFEVLVNGWTAGEYGSIPAGAVPAGNESNGTALFLCRGFYDGGVYTGRIRAGFAEGCHIGWFGQAVFLPAYEVMTSLFTPIWIPGNGTLPLAATQTGYVVMAFGGNVVGPLYACRGTHQGGVFPGTTGGITATVCRIETGNAAVDLTSYEVMGTQGAGLTGTYRIHVKANDRFWTEAATDKLISTRTQTNDAFARFQLQLMTASAYRAVVEGSGREIHAANTTDKLVSTRTQPDDLYTRFWFEQLANGSYFIRVQADRLFVHEDGNNDRLISTRYQPNDDFVRFHLERMQVSPTPALTTISTSPNPPVGTQAFTLTVNGSNFDPALLQIRIAGGTSICGSGTCSYTGAALTTKTATQAVLSVTLPAGTYTVTARNGDFGVESNGVSLPVGAAPIPTPILTSRSTSPTTPVAAQVFTLTLNGSSIDPATVQVRISGGVCPAGTCVFSNASLIFKSATQVVLPVTLSAAATYTIVLRNGDGGADSNSLMLTVNNPAPVLTSISPNPGTNIDTTYTLVGTGFDPANVQVAVVGGNTLNLLTKTATQITFNAAGPVGTFTLLARNGASGAESNTLSLTINDVTPVLTSLSTSPSPAVAGQLFTLTINGSKFDTGTSQVFLNNVGIPTSVLSTRTATQLVFSVTLSSTSYTVTVRNGPNGTPSNGLALNLNQAPPGAPMLTSLATSPSPAVTGQGFTLTVNGSGFDPPTAQILLDGIAAPNSALIVKTAAQLSMNISGAVAAGNHTITVRNGAAGTASTGLTLTVNSITSQGSHFVPITPCRAADTRSTTAIPAVTFRDFTFGACGIPGNATAIALNVTLVPSGQFGFLSIWPAGQAQPVVSTMNSLDGRIKANAAVVGLGTSQAVSVFVTDTAHVILDVNGYFVPAGTAGALAFYPVTPCRVVDTRNTGGGGVVLALGTRRIDGGGGCLPAQAQAYSLNVTVVPSGPLGFLTLWPEGSSQPVVSTLNDLTGTVVANAAILRAGTGGAFNAFVTDQTHLIVDLNGYFAPPGSPGALAFYPTPPCRIFDTRNPNGAFGGPRMEADTTRDFIVPLTACSVPATAQAYVTNATVVPPGIFGFLTLYPGGQARPTVSTLNAIDGALTSNAAIVPAGAGGLIHVYTSSATNLLLDISGYFAP